MTGGVTNEVLHRNTGWPVRLEVTYLRADARIDAEKRRRKKYEEDCARRAERAMRNDKN